MKHLRKNDQLNIRVRRETKAKIKRAARIESMRRGALVGPGPLLVELGMPAVQQILDAADALQKAS